MAHYIISGISRDPALAHAEALGYYLEKNLPDFHVQVIFKDASEWSDWVDRAIIENHWEGRLTANRSCMDKDSLSQLIYKNSGQLIGNTSDFIQWIKHCYALELKFNGLDEIAQVNHEFHQQILSEKLLKIALIPGDGIGKEVIPAAKKVLDRVISSTFVNLDAGFEHFQRTGNALPAETLASLKGCDGALFGAVSSPSYKVDGYSSPIVKLRKEMDLYANVRPVASAKGALGKPINMLIIRENTECLYIKDEKLEEENGLKVAWANRKISQFASERIARMAFKMAQQRDSMRRQSPNFWKGGPMVTAVHKSNVLSISDGLFRESVINIHKEFSDVKLEEQLVDSMVYRMFREPEKFDVIVAPNLYGDILSDGAAALVGSLGLVASANIGDSFVMGEPVHGSAPDIAGKGIANPIAAVRSAALLLENLGLTKEANKIYFAVDAVLEKGSQNLTPDMGGTGTTEEVTQNIIKNLK